MADEGQFALTFLSNFIKGAGESVQAQNNASLKSRELDIKEKALTNKADIQTLRGELLDVKQANIESQISSRGKKDTAVLLKDQKTFLKERTGVVEDIAALENRVSKSQPGTPKFERYSTELEDLNRRKEILDNSLSRLDQQLQGQSVAPKKSTSGSELILQSKLNQVQTIDDLKQVAVSFEPLVRQGKITQAKVMEMVRQQAQRLRQAQIEFDQKQADVTPTLPNQGVLPDQGIKGAGL